MSELMQYFSIINYSNITFSVNALGENIVRREWHYDSSCFLHSFVKLCVWVLFSPCTLVLPLNDDKPCYWETFKIIKDFRKMLCIWKIQLCFIIFSWCSSLFRSITDGARNHFRGTVPWPEPVTWPCLTARVAGKCLVAVWPVSKGNGVGLTTVSLHGHLMRGTAHQIPDFTDTVLLLRLKLKL